MEKEISRDFKLKDGSDYFVRNDSILVRKSYLDRARFEKYKLNGCEDGEYYDSGFQKERELEILNVLDKLGYDMNYVGTYLYKDIVFSTYCAIADTEYSYCKEFVSELKDEDSEFYWCKCNDYNLRNTDDIHGILDTTFEKIDVSKAEKKLIKQIFGNTFREQDLVSSAILIGYYVNQNDKYNCLDSTNEIKCLIKE